MGAADHADDIPSCSRLQNGWRSARFCLHFSIRNGSQHAVSALKAAFWGLLKTSPEEHTPQFLKASVDQQSLTDCTSFPFSITLVERLELEESV